MTGSIYKICTINSGMVSEGALVTKLTLKGAGVDIPVIMVGDTGRGRHQEVVAVQLPENLFAEWKEKGQVKVFAGKIGKTKSDKWKIFVEEIANDDSKIIAVFNTKIGFRGGNSHTGDRIGERKANSWSDDMVPTFADFPGTILVTGMIAQGSAGRMGSGEQLVAVMPKDVWFRTGYSGRLYGGPSAHYYHWNGDKLAAMTWAERQTGEAATATDTEEVNWL